VWEGFSSDNIQWHKHYEFNMYDTFRIDLDPPEPEIHLGLGTGRDAKQTIKVMMGDEEILAKIRSYC
jgi:UDP-N-acetylglucosamine 2-epimerase (non-hydrolysing)